MIENTRRDFLKKTAAASAAFLTPKFAAGALGANDRIRVAMIGVGSRGQELLKQIVTVPNTASSRRRRCLHAPIRRSQTNSS
jgi:hypothetical protein